MIILMVILGLIILGAAIAAAVWMTDAYLIVGIVAAVILIGAEVGTYFLWPDGSETKTTAQCYDGTTRSDVKDCPTPPAAATTTSAGGPDYQATVEAAQTVLAQLTAAAGQSKPQATANPGTGQQAQPTEETPQAAYSCTVQGKQRDLAVGSGRIYEDESLLADLKAFGGDCHVDFGSSVSFVWRSVEGVVKIDGLVVTNGNDIAANGKTFDVHYTAGDISNGFDLKF